ncbi:MAG TPA: tyrosine-type recombinase/integrase [Syntrophomonadaceae bacterium]|nr:tyrosine-type recombinase/integrase [Syntrophomonadaceae bacterium]
MSHIEEFTEWLYEEGKDEKTIRAYQTIVNQFTEWLTASTEKQNIAEIKPIDVKEYLGYMKHHLNRSQATINKSTAGLKTYFAFLCEKTYINDNPMTRIKLQKLKSTEQTKGVSKWLTKEEQQRFISYVELEKNEFRRLRNLAIIDLMLYCGLRVSEVEELKIEDIKTNGHMEITIREGKHGKYATVILIDRHSKNLKKWLKYRQDLEKGYYLESPYLFVSERSGKLTSRGIQVMVNKYADLASMEQVNCHRFRHSFCKNLADAGVNIQTIAELARHENINTTRLYVENSQEERIRALEKLI